MSRFAFGAAALLAIFSLGHAASAAEKITLPADPSYWINGGPVSIESLKGKGIVLYFFEEQCPTCEKKWPELAAVSKKYADKPVVFLAVSSGTARGDIEKYSKTAGVPWPVVLDPQRQIEQAAGVGEISLQNITQYVYITADGAPHRGNWTDVPGTIEKALVGAAWRVEPTGLPLSLKPAWQAIELGNFAAAAPALKKAAADKKPDVKAAGEKLQTAVNESMTQEIAAIDKSGDKWTTYKALRGIADRYKGYTLPEDFRKQGSELHQDEEVKRQIEALDALKLLERGLMSASPVVRKKSLDKLDKVIADFPGTDAAQMAEEFKERAAM